MSRASSKLLAAAGAGDSAVYVEEVFQTTLYKGNASTQNIVNGLDLSGEGGMVYIKCRSAAEYGAVYDTARGQSKVIYTALTSGQASNSDLSSFNNNGFSLSYTYGQTNTNNRDYVAWSFRKQEKFFDVVTYTGDGTTGRSVAHNLGSVPGMIWIKNLSSESWVVYHRGIGNTKSVTLNTTAAADTSSAYWNNTNPTSTHFTLGNAGGPRNENGVCYVAYLFAHDEQEYGEDSDEAIIKCGSYTGNTSSKPNINLGFEPQWVMIKCTTHSENWIILDSMRGIVTPDSSGTGADARLLADSGNAEVTSSSTSYIKLHANGFELTGTGGEINAASREYMYVAIARPHKPASELTATDLFKVAPRSNTSSADHAFVSNFPVDMGMSRNVLSGTEMQLGSRLTGDKYLRTPLSNAEATTSDWGGWDSMNSVSLGFSKSAESPVEKYGWLWRRAPGYFDVVAYKGTGGSTNTISHNLGVVPEMMWVKRRDGSDVWWVYHKDMTGTPHNAYMRIDATAAVVTNNDAGFGNTAPTATQFTVGGFPAGSGQAHIAYLFASTDGISKVGSYTGTGSNINIDCGFSNGARFVLLKRTDNAASWYLFDSERGIVADNDPKINLDTTAAQATNTDYIDPLSSGFTITSTATNELNQNGGSYIFYAIA